MFKVVCLIMVGLYVGVSLVSTIIGESSLKRLAYLIQTCAFSVLLYYVWLT